MNKLGYLINEQFLPLNPLEVCAAHSLSLLGQFHHIPI